MSVPAARGSMALALAVVVSLGAQTPRPAPTATGTGLIFGQCVDADGRPVRDVLVTLGGAMVPTVPLGRRLRPAPSPAGARQLLTNAQGQFVFSDLPAGVYTIAAARPGYGPSAFGVRRPWLGSGAELPAAQEIALAEGQRIGDVRITLWKLASMSGRVIDEADEPVIEVQVRALRRQMVGGAMRFVGAGIDLTDDRGMFEFGDLGPGDYIVAIVATQTTVPAAVVESHRASVIAGRPSTVTPTLVGAAGRGAVTTFGTRVGEYVLHTRTPSATNPAPDADGRIFVYPTTFHGGARLAQVQPITLRSGELRSGVDVQLRPVPASTVSGIVSDAGGPMPHRLVRLVDDASALEDGLEAATAVTGPDGGFTFLGVPPGEYRFLLTEPVAGSSSGEKLASAEPILVADRNVSGLDVRISRGFRVEGRVEFEGSPNRPASDVLRRVVVAFDAADGRTAELPAAATSASVDETGAFAIPGVPAGRYLVRVGLRVGGGVPMATFPWTLRSASSAGRDVSSLPLDVRSHVSGIVVTLTDRPAEIAGVVRDGQSRPDPNASVLLFPVDASAWAAPGPTPHRLRSARVGPTGTFTLTELPDGEYFLAAIDDAYADDWHEPAFLQTLARSATRVTLAAGDGKQIDLVTIGVRR